MRGVVHVAATAVLLLGAGCATGVDVSFDTEQDFSRYRTWDWLPRGRSVDALPGEEVRLSALTTKLVARELGVRGLEQASHAPDLLVAYQLRIVRRVLIANETGATDYLASHHSSPSYLVQSSRTRVEIRDYGDLYVVMTNGDRDAVVWRGRAWDGVSGTFDEHLARVVAELLDRFPVGKPVPEAKSAGRAASR
jgi:hypothetical protein